MMAANDSSGRAAARWYIELREMQDDPDVRRRFEAWLAADPSHLRAWAEMADTADVLATLRRQGAQPKPPKVPGRRTSRSGHSKGPSQRWRPAVAAVAVASVAFAMAPTLGLWFQADHISGTGQVDMVRLLDGSTVRLGPQSAIAVEYAGDERVVRLLRGEAMFEVRHDPTRPFKVLTGRVETQVIGTGFEVRKMAASAMVAVRHGRVRVADGDMRRALTAGQWVRAAQGRAMEGGSEAVSLVGAWQDGHIIVRNRPIAEVIDELRPWYGGRIILADPALGARPVTGAYDARDVSRSLDLIVAPYGGSVVHVTPWLRIVTGP